MEQNKTIPNKRFGYDDWAAKSLQEYILTKSQELFLERSKINIFDWEKTYWKELKTFTYSSWVNSFIVDETDSGFSIEYQWNYEDLVTGNIYKPCRIWVRRLLDEPNSSALVGSGINSFLKYYEEQISSLINDITKAREIAWLKEKSETLIDIEEVGNKLYQKLISLANERLQQVQRKITADLSFALNKRDQKKGLTKVYSKYVKQFQAISFSPLHRSAKQDWESFTTEEFLTSCQAVLKLEVGKYQGVSFDMYLISLRNWITDNDSLGVYGGYTPLVNFYTDFLIIDWLKGQIQKLDKPSDPNDSGPSPKHFTATESEKKAKNSKSKKEDTSDIRQPRMNFAADENKAIIDALAFYTDSITDLSNLLKQGISDIKIWVKCQENSLIDVFKNILKYNRDRNRKGETGRKYMATEIARWLVYWFRYGDCEPVNLSFGTVYDQLTRSDKNVRPVRPHSARRITVAI